MKLRVRHRARLKPAVKHIAHNLHLLAALWTFKSDCINIRLVQIKHLPFFCNIESFSLGIFNLILNYKVALYIQIVQDFFHHCSDYSMGNNQNIFPWIFFYTFFNKFANSLFSISPRFSITGVFKIVFFFPDRHYHIVLVNRIILLKLL